MGIRCLLVEVRSGLFPLEIGLSPGVPTYAGSGACGGFGGSSDKNRIRETDWHVNSCCKGNSDSSRYASR